MTHQQLWAPWRLAYVQTSEPKETQPSKPSCFLCSYRDDDPANDSRNLVVLRGEHSIVVLNRFPYNNGHLLIAPRKHKADLRDLNDAELLETSHLLQRMIGMLEKTISPDGFNVGLNLGRVAGAGLPGHLHWHIVPRWNGDTNFMPILGEAKVIPQALDALFDLLSKEMSSESESAS